MKYFKRNKVEAHSGKKSRERYFDYDRVADECDYQDNDIDRRILYEMTGIKISDLQG